MDGHRTDGRSPDGRSSDFIFCPMLGLHWTDKNRKWHIVNGDPPLKTAKSIKMIHYETARQRASSNSRPSLIVNILIFAISKVSSNVG